MSDSSKAQVTLLSLGNLTACLSYSFCQMNEATQITMPYTIAVYMVKDYLGPDASQAQISRLTGILVSHCDALLACRQHAFHTLYGSHSNVCSVRRQPVFVQHNLSPQYCSDTSVIHTDAGYALPVECQLKCHASCFALPCYACTEGFGEVCSYVCFDCCSPL